MMILYVLSACTRYAMTSLEIKKEVIVSPEEPQKKLLSLANLPRSVVTTIVLPYAFAPVDAAVLRIAFSNNEIHALLSALVPTSFPELTMAKAIIVNGWSEIIAMIRPRKNKEVPGFLNELIEFAAKYGDLLAVRHALKSGAYHIHTPLICAAERNHDAIITEILKSPQKDKLYASTLQSVLECIVGTGKEETILTVLNLYQGRMGKDIDYSVNGLYKTNCVAAKKGRIIVIEKILSFGKHHPIDLIQPLRLAAQNGHLEVMKILASSIFASEKTRGSKVMDPEAIAIMALENDYPDVAAAFTAFVKEQQ